MVDGELDVRGVIGQSDKRGSTFHILTHAGRIERVRTSLLGRHNVMNALSAAAAALALGVRPKAIREGIGSLRSVHGRLERVGPDDCPLAVVVDYAHTDHALENALRALRPITPNRLICVFGCGGDRDRTKRPRMGRVVSDSADIAYLTSDNPRSEDPMAIIEEVMPGFAPASQCHVAVEPDRAGAIREAISLAGAGDTVLIAGKGHETYQVIGDRRIHFDDAEVARACLESVKALR
jgi:UDP-N-acetylmuramyl-tripeptide synthetase